ncbi:[histone H3]-lysine(4) N-trimethyltransferase [Malassezia psittaci]|uniref:[histone H3]-lysine(4) N-trimethyltransferase n=1 Tax=Malassezia psittaci TaxID=1821823 RepID=A0AAF0F726_9BASI|nr:[histone H3]-lysine(4) N-trimethyltransferase [Malassezia psittaci]
MDELPADDDLLSGMLLDTLEFEPAILTHKLNPHQRPARFDRDVVSLLVRHFVIWERDLSGALKDFMQYVPFDTYIARLPVVSKHLRRKTPSQLRMFEKHVLRYLQAYLPDAGFEFAITHRYQAARLRRRITMQGDLALDSNMAASSTDYTDMCVLALRSYQPEEIILYCSAALKDLTRADDEALRDEAVQARTPNVRQGPPIPQRDFSIIRSSSRKLSQLLLGPARFINHDCQPNAEFRRSGHQLTIRCIRPIQRNDEITTYYGDNYFEAGNKECMCATCERRQRGYFSHSKHLSEDSSSEQPKAANDSRLLRSSQTAVSDPDPSVAHDMIQSTMDPDASGPVCECQTCHTSFRAPERWWVPDECSRCERHYKLYKADWPNRYPNEDPSTLHSTVRTVKHTPAVSQPNRRAKQYVSQSESSASSAAASPVKMSPIRIIHPDSDQEHFHERGPLARINGVHHQQLNGPSGLHLNSSTGNGVHGSHPTSPQPLSQSKRRKYEVRSDDSDEEFSRNHRALGPRILGHEASTDLLASYWGAPSGHRRTRRPASVQPQQVQEREASKRKGSEKTETSSLGMDNRQRARTAPPKPKSDIVRRPLKSGSISNRFEAASDANDSDNDTSRGTLEQSLSTFSSETKATPSSSGAGEQESVHTTDSKQEKPTIATKGPQRTSVSNLALFWSAGVEGRTRRRSRSQTSSTEPSADLHKNTAPQEKSRVTGKKSLQSNSEQISPILPAQGTPTSTSVTTSTELIAQPTHGTVTKISAESDLGNVTTFPHTSGEQTTPLSAPDGTLSSSEPASLSSIIKAESRSNSPLHMPSSIQATSTPVPRQPARRNLRWGSGKTSTSRPIMGGSSSTGVSLLSAITGRGSNSSLSTPSSRESSPKFTHENP